jgi:hypothetical protein
LPYPLDLVARLALLLLELPLAFDGEHTILELDLHVSLLDVGEIGFDHVLGLGLLDVDCRRPPGERELLVLEATEWTVAEHSVQACMDAFELTKRIPFDDAHMRPGQGLQQRVYRGHGEKIGGNRHALPDSRRSGHLSFFSESGAVTAIRNFFA